MPSAPKYPGVTSAFCDVDTSAASVAWPSIVNDARPGEPESGSVLTPPTDCTPGSAAGAIEHPTTEGDAGIVREDKTSSFPFVSFVSFVFDQRSDQARRRREKALAFEEPTERSERLAPMADGGLLIRGRFAQRAAVRRGKKKT